VRQNGKQRREQREAKWIGFSLRYYDLWVSRGAKFITEPKVHATELRCYMRDPDGYLIEVGQTTMTADPLALYS
jgi:hypothetical protein